MKPTDPRLKLIAVERNCNALVIAGIAAMIQAGISLEKGAEFSGKTPDAMRGIWEQIAALIEQAKPKRKANPAAKSKMTPDWQPTDVDLEYARDMGLDDVQIGQETVKFRAWHIDRGEARVWRLSWRTWVNNAAKAGKVAPSAPPPPADAEPQKIDWRAALETYRDIGSWPSKIYGPEPGQLGCRVPPEYLMRKAG